MTKLARALKIYLTRLAFHILGSEAIPASIRTRMLIGLGAQIPRSTCIWSSCKIRSHRLEFGENVFINVGFFFDGAEPLRIGNNVRMGQFVSVITATHEIGPPEQRCTMEALCRPVVIEEGCWIGAHVTMLPGAIVRKGCVIGTGSIVMGETQPNGLYVGTPARRIRDLPC